MAIVLSRYILSPATYECVVLERRLWFCFYFAISEDLSIVSQETATLEGGLESLFFINQCAQITFPK